MKKKIFRNFKSLLRNLRFCASFRKDDYTKIENFYKYLKFFKNKELKERASYINKIDYDKLQKLERDGFIKINLENFINNKNFFLHLEKLKSNFNKIDWVNIGKGTQKENFLKSKEIEIDENIKKISDPFIDIISSYTKYLPIMIGAAFWYSPNVSDEKTGSRSLHLDPDDYKQIKIFIPVDEITSDNGPLNVVDARQSRIIYNKLINDKIIIKRNQKISDELAQQNFKIKLNELTMKKNEVYLVDTCRCYHFGSRKSIKSRKLIFLHFTPPFSAKSPLFFRNQKKDNIFLDRKDQLIYGFQKNVINHYKAKEYIKI
ncbi:MAG: hypothetical protein CBD97_02380 [Pelagibacteraceae bacterium TMED237]|nr:MAG: hypothetical protein CBD97_02380 [Pelagibacteraceae bacterium TMED237]|tara:strand:+ start:22142 stop:23092 length:951 start_codon:yes stop_codon:yes gene_type:complete